MMEGSRGLDTLWLLRFVAEARRLVTLSLWQDMRKGDEVEAMIAALNRATLVFRPKPTSKIPVSRQFKRTLRFGVSPKGQGIANLLLPFADTLSWQQNPNYVVDPTMQDFLQKYGHIEIVGPNGYAQTDDVRAGVMLLAADAHYPMHDHPASELYFVVSGHGYFKPEGKPWRSSPAGQFIFHQPYQPHAIETRTKSMLAFYLWHGDVVTEAKIV